MKRLLILLLLSGCATERDTRMCADWGSFVTREERCTPLYGALVCVEQDVTKHYCKRYFEEEQE